MSAASKKSSSDIREISVSEFFSKNRHLLGFDNPIKSLLTAVREGVDNSLDACEEGDILPAIKIMVEATGEDRYVVTIRDNGPGISKTHLANIFGKLLYGSKFHRLKQSRGQQGIGISAAVMYGQMTTGRSSVIYSKTQKGNITNKLHLQINTKKNMPKVMKEEVYKGKDWELRSSGTQIAIPLEGSYKETKHGVLSYIRQTALSNPHAEFIFVDPKGKRHVFPRLTSELPIAPKEILPHPHGIELGMLIQLLHDARGYSIDRFLEKSFCRVSSATAKAITKKAKLKNSLPATRLTRENAEALYNSIKEAKLKPPPTNCLSPMGEEGILKALYWLFVESKRYQAEPELEQIESDKEKAKEAPALDIKKQKAQAELSFDKIEEKPDSVSISQAIEVDEEGTLKSDEEGFFVTSVKRPPFVYRGNPFQVEVGIFYGRSLKADSLATVYRFANRVPLQYQAAACAMSKAVMGAPWKSYGLNQSRGALPSGPVVIMMHIASVWVPYTSESKEAIAHYPEILKEFRLAIFECGRRLQKFLKRKRKEADEAKKLSYIKKYLSPISDALQDVLGFSDSTHKELTSNLEIVLENTREKTKLTEKK